jgi:DNA-binding transcriptional MerR regulator
MSGPEALSIDDLARAAGVAVRTVRYYISQGLLPGPGARGRAAAYDAEHLARLRLIRRLAEQHVPLAEQKERLAGLSSADIEALLRDEERYGAVLERATQSPSPRAYVSGLLSRARLARPVTTSDAMRPPDVVRPQEPESWRRWEIVPGVELFARAESARVHAQLIEQLLQIGRESPNRRSPQDAAFKEGKTPHAQ